MPSNFKASNLVALNIHGIISNSIVISTKISNGMKIVFRSNFITNFIFIN